MEIFTQPPTAKRPAQTFSGDVWVDLIHAGPDSRDGTVIEAHPDDSDGPQTTWGGPVTDAGYAAPRTSTR